MILPLSSVVSQYIGVGTFITGLILLYFGYVTYGSFVERVLAPDDRKTPALRLSDGVDYVVLPRWKNMLIQLLNIAGVGPVIGVIAGIKFGSIVFILIPIGNIIGGAVHDFISGMASLRNRGCNLPSFIKITLGDGFYRVFSIFMSLMLLLVVAVFINVPAHLLDTAITPHDSTFWFWVFLIFLYYIIVTMFPVDKIIGRFYPIFGGVLLVGSVALLFSLLFRCFNDPAILLESGNFVDLKSQFLKNHPILPCLFVTIACGIISGFHATQSPIIARTMKSEREARSSFYGMMVLEGVIAMIWAGAALVVYNKFLLCSDPSLFWEKNPNDVLPIITEDFLGKGLGVITVLAVVILAVTSGDTAMRSLRLSIAEMLNVNQKALKNRFIICLPLILVIGILLWWSNLDSASFGKLWNYFAWANQVLAATTLGACCVWLYAQKRSGWIAVIPCSFMTFIVVSFILWTSEVHKGPAGFGLDLRLSYILGVIVAIIFTLWCVVRGKKLEK